MRYDKKIKTMTFSENDIFFDEKYFSKDFEKSKISKSHFFNKKWKLEKVDFFEKKKNLTFWNSRFFPQKHRKIWFLKIFDFQNLSKKYLSSKKSKFSDFFYFLFFYRVSCIISASGIAELPLCRPWAR